MCTGTRPGLTPAIWAGKGGRGRRELAPRCSATQLAACRHDLDRHGVFFNHPNHNHHTALRAVARYAELRNARMTTRCPMWRLSFHETTKLKESQRPGPSLPLLPLRLVLAFSIFSFWVAAWPTPTPKIFSYLIF